jgi:DNA-binding transcriptional ArsR family regulator
MLDALFGNPTAEKVLLYLQNYGEGWTNGIAKTFGFPPNQVYVQLRRLEDGGIVVARDVGNTRLYTFNPRWRFKKELGQMLEAALAALPEAEIEKYYRARKRPRRTGKRL